MIIDKERNQMFYVQATDTLRGNSWIAHKSTTLSGAVRKMNGMMKKNVNKNRTFDVLNSAEYEHIYGQMVQRTNIMTGKTFWERADTPGYLSPSSEAYWSM
jgi:hypothetical protein